jgi:predicted RNase H-like nuclease (RuvC/YqgF family)
MSTLEEDYRALKRLHDATNIAVEELQAKNQELMEENMLLLKKIIDCQNALDINKEVMRNALTIQNQIKDEYTTEINELRAKIKNQG